MAGQALPWRGKGEDDLKLYFGQGLPPSVKGECSINSKDPETAPTRSKLHWFQTHQSSRPLEPSTINQAVEQPSSVKSTCKQVFPKIQNQIPNSKKTHCFQKTNKFRNFKIPELKIQHPERQSEEMIEYCSK